MFVSESGVILKLIGSEIAFSASSLSGLNNKISSLKF